MADVFDVAAYILEKQGGMTTLKLQKLVYYSQAWSIVWGAQLFSDPILAWADGPVVRSLFNEHRRYKNISLGQLKSGTSSRLSISTTNIIDIILETYGHFDADALSTLTHLEDPWMDARKGLYGREKESPEIPINSMRTYYSLLEKTGIGVFPKRRRYAGGMISDYSSKLEHKGLPTKVIPKSTTYIDDILFDLDLVMHSNEYDNEDNFAPTVEVCRKMERLLRQSSEYVLGEYPLGTVYADGDGGLRLEWIRPGCELRVVMPGTDQYKPYIYHERGDDYGAEYDFTPRLLGDWLDWLNANS